MCIRDRGPSSQGDDARGPEGPVPLPAADSKADVDAYLAEVGARVNDLGANVWKTGNLPQRGPRSYAANPGAIPECWASRRRAGVSREGGTPTTGAARLRSPGKRAQAPDAAKIRAAHLFRALERAKEITDNC
eukprot:5628807-Alexandrium_andersonii.AAC.1